MVMPAGVRRKAISVERVLVHYHAKTEIRDRTSENLSASFACSGNSSQILIPGTWVAMGQNTLLFMRATGKRGSSRDLTPGPPNVPRRRRWLPGHSICHACSATITDNNTGYAATSESN